MEQTTERQLCACGCGVPVAPKTPGRAAVYRHGHNPVPVRQTPLGERFWPKVDRRRPDECWPWLGGRDKDGRGRVWFEGRNMPAPRASLILAGVEVPSDAFACHHCDSPPCVNPEHLYVGTPMTNVSDMDSRGRRVSRVAHPASAGERNHNAKLTDAQVAEIRQRYSGTRGEQTALAREYGVTQALVHMIVKGSHRG